MRKRLKNHFIPHRGNHYKPHFVRGKSLTTLAFSALLLFGVAFSLKSIMVKYPDLLSAVITGVLVDLTNTSRATQNLSPLAWSPSLSAIAQMKANDMAQKGYFAHVSPDNKSPWYWFAQGGYKFVYAGENLAVNFIDSEDVVDAWMNSPTHRANIMNERFTEIGMAIASGQYKGRDSLFVVQVFGRPASSQQFVSSVVSEQVTSSLDSSGDEQALVSGATASSEKLEVLEENPTFIAVENPIYTQASSSQEVSSQSNLLSQVVASPKNLLNLIYIVLGVLMFVALLLLTFIHPGQRHKKNIFYVLLFLSFLSLLIYLTTNHLFPEILVQ
jgi:hypothetical protein